MLRIAPTTCITGVAWGKTLVLMSESGSQWPGAWAWATTAPAHPIRPRLKKNGRMHLNYSSPSYGFGLRGSSAALTYVSVNGPSPWIWRIVGARVTAK